jgi:hypothetical protein
VIMTFNTRARLVKLQIMTLLGCEGHFDAMTGLVAKGTTVLQVLRLFE